MGKVLHKQALPPDMRERVQRAQTLEEQVPSAPVHCLINMVTCTCSNGMHRF